MGDSQRTRTPCQGHRTARTAATNRSSWLRSWVALWSVVTGILALLWVVLRSGTKPSRLAYPCQQAAAGTALLAIGVPLAAAIVAGRRRLAARLRTRLGKVSAGFVAALAITLLATASLETGYNGAAMEPPPGYTPEVFLVNNTRGIEPGRFGGVDDLITLMGIYGLKWHRSESLGWTFGPTGLIDRDDVVLIKINAQWSQRGGTNTDVLRGVIRRIVEHPDGFIGEIVVADNGQGGGSVSYAESNAEDHTQSTQDVVDDFALEGWNVSTFLWDGMKYTSVAEYSSANMTDGYVVNPALDPETSIRVSYPKFQSASGTYVSYKYGIWSPKTQTYDSDKLVVINIPVFKTHSIYGVTASVKNHMGVVTRELSTDSHNAVGRGGLGSMLADVRMPDLTILDCIWILARPGQGPSASYASASRRDQLLASVDPLALDVWAVKNILIPQIIENGYSPAEYFATQDPDNPDSKFRKYLDATMNELLAAGIDTTNDYNAVELHVWTGGPIPTVSTWGLIVSAILLITLGSIVIRRQQMVAVAA